MSTEAGIRGCQVGAAMNMITYCPKCGIANRLGDERCQVCDGRLRQPTAEELAAPRTSYASTASDPNYVLHERDRWAGIASRSLLSATMISITRAMLMPTILTWFPRGTFGRIDAAQVQQNGYLAASGFCIAAIWCRRDPLFPSIAALCIYLGLAIPDTLDGTTLLSRGIISKSLMVLFLLRAVNAAIQHRSIRRRPAIAALEA